MNIWKVSRYCSQNFLSSILRRNAGSYEGHGRTTATIINDTNTSVNMIAAYSLMGFRLTSGAFVMGPMILLRDKIFFWNVGMDENISEESLEFFFHLHPPLDLLIVGYSEPENRQKIDQRLQLIGNQHNLQMEILPTTKAVSVYNFLVEARNVGGAFIPPAKYAFNDDDVIDHKDKLGLIDFGREVGEDRDTILKLAVVGLLWGCTNPLMKHGSAGLKTVSGALPSLRYLLTNWKYTIPLSLNQIGSILFLIILRSNHISLCVPVANSLALVFTFLTSWILKEKRLTNRVLFGTLFVICGIVFLINHELSTTKR